MANSLRAKISKLRHDGRITEEEHQTLVKKLDGHDKQIRAEAIDECADMFAETLSNMTEICGRNCPVKCNWGTDRSCKDMCKKWFVEQIKEQK